MLLVVDIGNTQTHLGAFEGTELSEHWRFQTRAGATGDELAERISGLMALSGAAFSDVDAVCVSSVVPPLGNQYEQLTERYLEADCLLVEPGIKTGMAIRIDNPLEVGADRLVNAVAAYDQIGGACVVVDFGTGQPIAAIQSGVVFGFAGLIDGVARRIEEELGEARFLATGGLASTVVPFTETIDEVDDQLTLKGLRLIHERNQ
jgi:type III pantothenate kinase